MKPTIAPMAIRPKKSPIRAGNRAVTPPYENPKTAAAGYNSERPVLSVKPRNDTACRNKHRPRVGTRPKRSEIGAIASRPANPAKPITLIVIAARKWEIPRSTAKGTIWTMGMNTTNHVKANMTLRSQNAVVRLASARLQFSNTNTSRAASLGAGSCGGCPSGSKPIFSGSRTMNVAHETRPKTASKPRIKYVLRQPYAVMSVVANGGKINIPKLAPLEVMLSARPRLRVNQRTTVALQGT